jgi:hypothetical protein
MATHRHPQHEYELWLCPDCTIAEVNGDYSGMSDERAEKVAAGIERLVAEVGPLSANWDETGEGINDFTSRPCDACGTRLAGERNRFAAFGRSVREGRGAAITREVAVPHPALVEQLAADVDALREARGITFDQAYDAIVKPEWVREYEASGGDMIALGNRVINKAKSIGRARHPIMRAQGPRAEARRSPRGRRAPTEWTTDNTQINTWFERDRASVVLETLDGTTIVEWWDDAVHEAVQDGFLDPRDWHGSAVEQANTWAPPGVREESHGSPIDVLVEAVEAARRVDWTGWYIEASAGDRVIYTDGPYPSKIEAAQAARAARAARRGSDLTWSDPFQGMDMGHAPLPHPPRATQPRRKPQRRR